MDFRAVGLAVASRAGLTCGRDHVGTGLLPRECALWKNRDLDKVASSQGVVTCQQVLVSPRSLRSGADGGNAMSPPRFSLLLPAPTSPPAVAVALAFALMRPHQSQGCSAPQSRGGRDPRGRVVLGRPRRAPRGGNFFHPTSFLPARRYCTNQVAVQVTCMCC